MTSEESVLLKATLDTLRLSPWQEPSREPSLHRHTEMEKSGLEPCRHSNSPLELKQIAQKRKVVPFLEDGGNFYICSKGSFITLLS